MIVHLRNIGKRRSCKDEVCDAQSYDYSYAGHVKPKKKERYNCISAQEPTASPIVISSEEQRRFLSVLQHFDKESKKMTVLGVTAVLALPQSLASLVPWFDFVKPLVAVLKPPRDYGLRDHARR